MKHKLADAPIHLSRGGGASVLTPIDGADWYEDYGERTASDGVDGRLVSEFAMDGDWDHWEMHPDGSEIVYCLSGRFRLHQENAGTADLAPGDYVVNAAGVWHTADVIEPGRALFITVGQGTQHKPR